MIEYGEYCSYYAKVWSFLKKHSPPREQLVTEICERRGYKNVKRWQKLFAEVDVAKVNSETFSVAVLRKALPEELGLFGNNGFLLDNSYMIPIRDMKGNILALVGWIPGKKYITTPAAYFDRSCLFFGMEQFSDYNPRLAKNTMHSFFVVEGIFDSLSLRSLGFKCLGNMGIDSSKTKTSLYALCRKVVGIPDGDKAGRSVIEQNKWNIPLVGGYVQIPFNAADYNIKDVDDIIKSIPGKEAIELFGKLLKSDSRITTIEF
jgi:DNA primase